MSNNRTEKSTKAKQDRKRILELMLKKKGLASGGESRSALIPRRSEASDLALSNAQQRLWFLEEFTVDTVAYVFCNRVDLKGEINLSALRNAYQTIVDRHEIFRTSYQQQDGVPSQLIHRNIAIDIPLIDLHDLPENEKKIKLQDVVDRESKKPFDMTVAPLMRMCVVKMSGQHHVVLQTIHHIVYDGWSLAVMYNELKSLYEAYLEGRENPLADLDIQYADYASWLRAKLETAETQEKLAFWKQTLAGDLPKLDLPADKPRPASQSYNGALHRINLSTGITSSLKTFAAKNECTVYMVLLATFKVLLHRYTGEIDIIVGTPVANRNYHQIEKLIGFFVNSLVLRTSLQDDPHVIELLSRVRETASKAFSNQEAPFDKVVDELNIERDISHNPIFQVMFAFQNTPDLPNKIGAANLELEILDNGTSVFDITLNLHDSAEGIYGYIEYCTDLFEAQTIERMAEHYQILLQSIIRNPGSRVSELQLMTQGERHQILNTWNDTHVNSPPVHYIHQLIEEQASLIPDAKAVCHEDKQLTYAELNEQANQLARYLRTLGVDADQIVGICMERSIEMFVGILAILKAGGAYLPLDPSYPGDRLSFMLEDTAADILVTKQSLVDELPKHSATLVCLDSDWNEIAQQEKSNLNAPVSPDDLVYIIYTSGSTGKPKGVMVTHRNLIHSTAARIAYYQEKMQRFLLLSSFAFDSSVAGIFWTLCEGGELHLPKQGVEQDIQQVAALLQKVQATHMLSLPSIYGLLLGIAEDRQLDSLNTIIVAGEACPPELSMQHSTVLPQAGLFNEYGPTEATVWSTVYRLEENDKHQSIPIGRPIPNVKVYILDENLQPVPVGVVGEIYIAGAGITRGYLNREEMTAEKFIKSPFGASEEQLYRSGDLAKYMPDGNILFCGRTDHQVKIRGYRIELGEIESALCAHECIKDVVVIAKQRIINAGATQAQDGTADVDLVKTQRLVAYVVANNLLPPKGEELQALLKRSLPDYMVPHSFVFIDKIPLSANGKVDIKALPDQDQDRTRSSVEFARAENPIEEILTEIWSSVLGMDQVGIHDNFFEIGGDSILSIQIIARAKNRGVHISPKQIFENSTIAGLAKVAKTEHATKAEQGLVTGDMPLTPIQRWLLERALPNPDYWNQAAMLEVPKDLNTALLEQSIDHIIIHHDALRSCFIKQGDGWSQSIVDRIEPTKVILADLSSATLSDSAGLLTAKTNDIQASLKLDRSKLLAAVRFKMPKDTTHDRLFIAAHHLVIDTVSWATIVEDLETAYSQLQSAKKVELPAKTTSSKEWSNALTEYAHSDALAKDIDYWSSMPDKDVFDIPVDIQCGDNNEASERKLTVLLTEDETEQLLRVVPPVYNTKIDDILLTALAQVITAWTGGPTLSLGMEGHGREQINDDIDLSRSVGWFTSYFPVALHYGNKSHGENIKSIKEQLRAIPNKGISYGVLRYTRNDQTSAKKLATIDQTNILYNYLGQFNRQEQSDAIFNVIEEDNSRHHDLAGPRSHLIEIDSMIVDHQLKLDWVYSENIHHAQTIQKLADDFIAALRHLIQHCQAPEAGGFSASDFPEANLAQDDLDDLLDMLDD